jgi:hypothetical protein
MNRSLFYFYFLPPLRHQIFQKIPVNQLIKKKGLTYFNMTLNVTHTDTRKRNYVSDAGWFWPKQHWNDLEIDMKYVQNNHNDQHTYLMVQPEPIDLAAVQMEPILISLFRPWSRRSYRCGHYKFRFNLTGYNFRKFLGTRLITDLSTRKNGKFHRMRLTGWQM